MTMSYLLAISSMLLCVNAHCACLLSLLIFPFTFPATLFTSKMPGSERLLVRVARKHGFLLLIFI